MLHFTPIMEEAVASSHRSHYGQDGPHMDRWHYLDYRDTRHDENYIEWKYFNFIQDDLSGYIIYYLLDPERKSGLGGGRLLVRIFKDRTLFGSVKHIDIDRIQLDPVSASAVFDRASIIEHDAHNYAINSDFEDASWQLTYRQRVPTIDSFSDIHPAGLMSWVKASWLIKMPKAQVNGIMRIGDMAFSINGLGYSDTNWGEFLPFFSQYEWGQFNDGALSLVFGILLGLKKIKKASLYFAIGEHVVPLSDAQCTIIHSKWARDEYTGMKIPSQSRFALKKDDYSVTFTTNLIQSDSPGLQINRMLPKMVVSEQLVQYNGLIEKGGKRLYEFRGKGFQEWSTRTWRNIALSF